MPSSLSPLAYERFRTIIADALENSPSGGRGHQSAEVESIADAFPHAHFEYATNVAGVRVRRVVVASEWEVDPEAGCPVHGRIPCEGLHS